MILFAHRFLWCHNVCNYTLKKSVVVNSAATFLTAAAVLFATNKFSSLLEYAMQPG